MAFDRVATMWYVLLYGTVLIGSHGGMMLEHSAEALPTNTSNNIACYQIPWVLEYFET